MLKRSAAIVRKAGISVTALIALVLGVSGARASLIGDTVDAKYLFPTFTSVQEDGGNKVIGSAHPLYPSFPTDAPGESVDITASQIIFQFLGTSFHTAASFNGIGITDLINAFTSVTLDAATNLPGFTAADVGITAAGEVFVNWQNLAYNATERVVLDVTTAATGVPEPASLALLATALIGLGTICGRRKRL